MCGLDELSVMYEYLVNAVVTLLLFFDADAKLFVCLYASILLVVGDFSNEIAFERRGCY